MSRKQSPDDARHTTDAPGKEQADLESLEQEMSGLLRALSAAGREVAAEHGAAMPDLAKRPGADLQGEPSPEQLEALEDELEGALEEEIDEEELAALLAGAADGPLAGAQGSAPGAQGGATPKGGGEKLEALEDLGDLGDLDDAALGDLDDAALGDLDDAALDRASAEMMADGGSEALLAKLLGGLAAEGALDEAPEPEPEPETPQTPAQLIHAALERSLKALLAKELLEFTSGASGDDLLEQVLGPVLAAPSLDAALNATLEGFVESEHVEEVYGDDDELLQIFREAFEAVHKEALGAS